jgi:ketosteroid isomerase-like protein
VDEAEIHRRYARLSDADPLVWIADLAEDVVFNQASEVPGTAGRFEGWDGARAMFAEIADAYEGIVWRPVEVERLPDGRWLVLLEASARGTTSGVPVEVKIGHICRFTDDDRLRRMDVYLDWDKAREAARRGSW